MNPSQPGALQFIDLHAHTTASDGTLTPAELISLARSTGLAALAITDHDTFSGYEEAQPLARAAGLDLVRGIELNTRFHFDGRANRRTAHILAYFVHGEPGPAFTNWIEGERLERRTRNARLADSLQAHGIDITLEEVEKRGRILTGRPHFASLLVEKGYVRNSEEAFRKYLGEQAPSYIERQSKTSEEVIAIIRDGGGIASVAHPIRLRLPREEERELLIRFKQAGLAALEVYHSEHPPDSQAYYRQLAAELDLLPTGGSDFHGAIKPDIQLGTGAAGNLRVPAEFLRALRAEAPTQVPVRNL